LANEEAKTNKDIAKHLGINLCDVTRWTKRWIDRAMESVEERLSDLPRSGAPDRITAEQWCQIMALACEPPEEHGLPITHWTHKELAQEAVKQGIVEAISPSHVGNVLKKKTCNPIEAVTG
jgi:putative transposase